MRSQGTLWSVPRMWPGKTVAILASGPGMSAEIAAAVRQSNLPCIAINDTYRLAPFADMLYGADSEWWEHRRGVPEFSGIKVCCQFTVLGVLVLKHTGTSGFDDNPAHVRTGSNSGYQAVHIAVHAGASRVLLFGFDMQGSHWHGPHLAPLRNTSPDTFEKFREHFTTLAPVLKSRGVEVLNCTPDSRLACFEFSDPFAALRKYADSSPKIGPPSGSLLGLGGK